MTTRDSALVALISGFAGGLVYQVFVWVFYSFGIAKVTPFGGVNYFVYSLSMAISRLKLIQKYNVEYCR